MFRVILLFRIDRATRLRKCEAFSKLLIPFLHLSAVFLFQTQPLSTVAFCAVFCGENYACLLVFGKNSLDGGSKIVFLLFGCFQNVLVKNNSTKRGNSFEKFASEYKLSDYADYVWNANYKNKGRNWEREAEIHIFDTEQKLVLSQKAGIRIQGGASRSFNPKSLIYWNKKFH